MRQSSGSLFFGLQRSETIQALRRPYSALSHADCEDALTCALVASLFAEKRSTLMPPEADVSPGEGWVWVPRGAFAQVSAVIRLHTIPICLLSFRFRKTKWFF